MIGLGEINGRQIFYSEVRADPTWFDKIPSESWLAFTIADLMDKEILIEATAKVVEKSVLYICCSGQIAGLSEQLFDEEIVNRAIESENTTGKPFDYENSATTTMHESLDEGFWFSTYLAFDPFRKIDKIVCLNFTKRDLKKRLKILIDKFNEGWIPPDD